MKNEEIFNELVDIIKESLDDESIDYSKITCETHVFGEIIKNSIAALYVSLAIEDHFGIRIKNEDIKHLVKVGDFLEYISLNRH